MVVTAHGKVPTAESVRKRTLTERGERGNPSDNRTYAVTPSPAPRSVSCSCVKGGRCHDCIERDGLTK